MEYILKKITCNTTKITEYSKLLSDVFQDRKKFNQKYLNWLYLQNPYGKVYGYDVYYDNKLVAHYATLPVKYILKNKEYKGLLSLNTAVHKDHQGQGLFSKIAKLTIDSSKQDGYDFIVGVSNQNSTHGFVNKLGFKLVCPLETYLVIGKLNPLKKSNNLFSSEISAEFFNWRLKNPNENYIKTSKGVIKRKFGILDFLITTQLRNTKIKSLGIINVLIGKNTHKLDKSQFYFSIPKFLKPSPLNLIFKSNIKELMKINSKDFYFELKDFDVL